MRVGRKLTKIEQQAYTVLPSEYAEKVRVCKIPSVLGIFQGITLGTWIFLCTNERANGTSTLLTHELVHVRQWKEFGAIGFLSRYLSGFVSGIRKHKHLKKAYLSIPFEKEAREETANWANNGHTFRTYG